MTMIAATMITATRAVGAAAANSFSIIFGSNPARCQDPKQLEKLNLEYGKYSGRFYILVVLLFWRSLRDLPAHHAHHTIASRCIWHANNDRSYKHVGTGTAINGINVQIA